MNIYTGVKSVSCSTNTGESEAPDLCGEPFETIEIVSTTGGRVLVNLHSLDEARSLLYAVTVATARIRDRIVAKQATEQAAPCLAG